MQTKIYCEKGKIVKMQIIAEAQNICELQFTVIYSSQEKSRVAALGVNQKDMCWYIWDSENLALVTRKRHLSVDERRKVNPA